MKIRINVSDDYYEFVGREIGSQRNIIVYETIENTFVLYTVAQSWSFHAKIIDVIDTLYRLDFYGELISKLGQHRRGEWEEGTVTLDGPGIPSLTFTGVLIYTGNDRCSNSQSLYKTECGRYVYFFKSISGTYIRAFNELSDIVGGLGYRDFFKTMYDALNLDYSLPLEYYINRISLPDEIPPCGDTTE